MVIMEMEMIEDQGPEVKKTKILIVMTDDNVDGHCYDDGEVIEDQGLEDKNTNCGDRDYCKLAEKKHVFDNGEDAADDKNNLVSQGLQRGQTRELEAERGSRQEFLQVVNSQRDR